MNGVNLVKALMTIGKKQSNGAGLGQKERYTDCRHLLHRGVFDCEIKRQDKSIVAMFGVQYNTRSDLIRPLRNGNERKTFLESYMNWETTSHLY